MPLILKRFDEGVWVDWDGAADVKLKIRPLTMKIIVSIRESCKQGKVAVSLPEIDPRTGKAAIEIVDNYDDALSNWKLFQHCLEDSQGILLETEETLSKDKIIEVLYDHPVLRKFITDRALELGNLTELKIRDESKN